ncbi:hypothetical protein Cgig2_017421 [Carnegiea gigantea]|uniref:Reverse transcriptase zinc-binding domain-containing protein n=1 Tax=Carnegiea gigantea TaxID=171969 RepID=A0A9Q1JW25_9CARY|nr:hypothetical protein Cgig2_017421 [Carnegiea gigantea]
MVNSIFLPVDMEAVSSIPRFSPGQVITSLSTSSSGELTLKSAYHLILQCQHHDIAASSTTTMQTFWKTLWHLDIPPRMKMFTWRACSNALPSNYAIAKRSQDVDARCTLFSRFDFCSFSHVRRTGNRVAHALAHLQPFSLLCKEWFGDGPDHVHELALQDLCTVHII